MAAEKKVKMLAITRVGLEGEKVALPGQPFEIAEAEVERLEREGAAKKAKAERET